MVGGKGGEEVIFYSTPVHFSPTATFRLTQTLLSLLILVLLILLAT